MTTKVQTYTELAVSRTAAVTSRYEEWSAFLAVAARVYKYPFLEQLMIYVQRPDATACAEYQVWTRRMRRYVRRGSQGIALVYAQGGKPAVRYVFDVSDTGPLANALSPNLWQYRDEHRAAVSAALEHAYQVPGDSGLPVQAAYIAARLADSAWQQYRERLVSQAAKGVFGDYSEENFRLAFQDAVSSSVTYMVLSRCGLRPEQCFDASDFAHVYEFNTYPAVLLLGTAVSQSAGEILRCIEAAVKAYTPEPPTPPGEAAAPSAREQEEQIEEVPDVQAPDTSFVPPPEAEELPVQQEISTLPLALTPTAPPAGNFRITDDRPAEGGPKAKFRANVEAIKVLNFIEADGRTATREEQEVLSRYVGWGGIPEAFDPENAEWTTEYRELKELLSEAEYSSAQASTLNAHYTSPTVIRAIYEAVEHMGFKAGNILEPSCGIGNFFGCLPEAMTASWLYGVELDSLSARIARQLYPKAHITAAGFETTDRRDFYDLAVGNVPFGDYKVNDPAYLGEEMAPWQSAETAATAVST